MKKIGFINKKKKQFIIWIKPLKDRWEEIKEARKMKVTNKDLKIMTFQFVAAALMLFSVILYDTGVIKTILPQKGIFYLGILIFIMRMKK